MRGGAFARRIEAILNRLFKNPGGGMRTIILISLITLQTLCAQSIDTVAHRTRALQAMDQWKKVARMQLEYEAAPLPLPPIPADDTRVRNVIAVGRPNLLFTSTSHFSEFQSWDKDPMCHDYYVAGTETRLRWAFSRSYTEERIEPGDTIPGSIWADSIWLVLPYWPISDYKLPSNRALEGPTLFIDFAQLPDTKVGASLEEVAGEPCLVWSREATSRYWTAINKGHCIMKRQVFDRTTGLLIEEMNALKTTEVRESLWLATEFRIDGFVIDRRTGERSQARRTQVRVVKWQFNDEVSDHLFSPKVEPGEIKVTKSSVTQMAPGGHDLLEKVVDYVTHSPYVGHRLGYRRVLPHLGAFLAGIALGAWLLHTRYHTRARVN